jgi:hypothetical protein
MDKRLGFFEKDEVKYSEGSNEYFDFYKSLTTLKHENEVFWNGASGGDFQILDVASDFVFAFKRYNSLKDAFVILNLTALPQKYTVPKGMAGAYTDYFSGESTVMNESEESELNPWGYKVYLEK